MPDELIYARGQSDQDGTYVAVPYRVIKRTKTRIYVDREIYNEISRAWWNDHPEHQRCFTLDRQKLERHGCAYSPVKHSIFFSTEEAVNGDWIAEVPF